MSKGCSKCGMPNPDDSRFCRACGAALDTVTAAPATATPVEAPCRACGHRNRPGARFCVQCGADQSPPAPVPVPPPALVVTPVAAPLPQPVLPAFARARRPIGRWIGLAAVVVVLAAGTVGWLSLSRSPPLPSFDAAPPPSVLGASGPTVAASMPADTGPQAPVAPAPLPQPPIEPASAPASGASEPPEPTTANDNRNPREARADTLREPRARSAAPAATPAPPRAVAAAPRTAAARTVPARCANRNPLVQAICESRECVRTEHADEPVCQRIKAADERRRQQEGGG